MPAAAKRKTIAIRRPVARLNPPPRHGAREIRGLPFNIDDDSHTTAAIEVSSTACGLAVHVSATLNESDEDGPDEVRLRIFADGLTEPTVALDLRNQGMSCMVDLALVEGIGLALLTLHDALRRAGIVATEAAHA